MKSRRNGYRFEQVVIRFKGFHAHTAYAAGKAAGKDEYKNAFRKRLRFHCRVQSHHAITTEELLLLENGLPDFKILLHPECSKVLIQMMVGVTWTCRKSIMMMVRFDSRHRSPDGVFQL